MSKLLRGLYTFNVYEPDPLPPTPEPKVFKQEDVDRIVADARRKDQGEIAKHTAELKKLQSAVGATAAEKAELQQRIEAIEDQYKTKEQLAAQELERRETKYKVDLEFATTERTHWKEQFETTTISTAILREATDAVNIEQLEDLLKSKSRVIPVKDGEGKVVPGAYQVMVKVTVTDAKTKKPVTLDVSIDEAIKQMKQDVPRYGNLFKTTISSGLGGSGSRGKPSPTGPIDGDTIKGMTDQEYREYRKTQGLGRR